MEGRSSNSSTIRDVGNAVFVVLGHLPGCVVQAVGFADPLDAMKVDWVAHLTGILPA